MVSAMSYAPHPHLYAGIDDWGLALDEINGAGWNDRIWPDTFDAGRVPPPMLVAYPYKPDEDYCVRDEKRRFTVRYERHKACVGET
jgi:hypothetical protein